MSYEIVVMLKNSTDQTFKVKDYTVTENWLCLKENDNNRFWINREEIKEFIAMKKEDGAKDDDGWDSEPHTQYRYSNDYAPTEDGCAYVFKR